jgi:site-specific recombinase XerD
MLKSEKISAASGLRRLPYTMRPVKYLTRAETESFFGVIPQEELRDRVMFDLIYRHGLRRTEARLLRIAHIQGPRIWIGRVKNGVSGEYPLHPTTVRLLEDYLAARKNAENPFLFISRQCGEGPMSSSTIYQAFRRYAELAGIQRDHQHVHVLRHSIAVHLMNAGWAAEDVQDWLGHKCISSTMIYATVSNQRRESNYEKTVESGEIAKTDVH